MMFCCKLPILIHRLRMSVMIPVGEPCYTQRQFYREIYTSVSLCANGKKTQKFSTQNICETLAECQLELLHRDLYWYCSVPCLRPSLFSSSSCCNGSTLNAASSPPTRSEEAVERVPSPRPPSGRQRCKKFHKLQQQSQRFFFLPSH